MHILILSLPLPDQHLTKVLFPHKHDWILKKSGDFSLLCSPARFLKAGTGTGQSELTRYLNSWWECLLKQCCDSCAILILLHVLGALHQD